MQVHEDLNVSIGELDSPVIDLGGHEDLIKIIIEGVAVGNEMHFFDLVDADHVDTLEHFIVLFQIYHGAEVKVEKV